MIEPEEMTFLQAMYSLCSLGVALSAKQKNKRTMNIFARYGSILTGATLAEAEENNNKEEVIEFMYMIPFVTDKLAGTTSEDRQFLEDVAKEQIGDLIDVKEFFNKDKNHQFVMSEEDFNKFMNGYKKEDNINAS